MRGPRLELVGGLYHVYTRGNNRARIFGESSQYGRFRRSLGEAVERYRWVLHAFALMPTHIHLMLELTETNLSRGMNWLLSGYAQFRNVVTGRVGHVFGERFHSELCERESYRLELVRYIHMNPVKAGHVADPAAWEWSSHRAYLGLEFIPWLTPEPILESFGVPADSSRRRRFHEFAVARLTARQKTRIARLEGGWVHGSEVFIEEMKRLAAQSVRRHDRKTDDRPFLVDLAACVASEHGMPVAALTGRGKHAATIMARSQMVRQAVQQYRYSASTVARFLNRDKALISRILARKSNVNR